MRYKHELSVAFCFCLIFLLSSTIVAQLSQEIRDDVVESIADRLKKRGYAASTTFQDIDSVFYHFKSQIDTTTSLNSFVVVLNSVLETYGLSHFTVWDPEYVRSRAKASETALGARFSKTDHGYFVNTVMRKSPAADAGIRRGDLLITVNEEKLQNSDALYGQDGDEIEIDLVRDGDTLRRTLRFFPHRPYSRDSLYWIEDGVAVIEVHSFRRNLYDRALIESFFAQVANARGLILDLRSNGGGYSEHVRHLLAMIIEPGTTCQYVVHREEYDRFVARENREPSSLHELALYVNNRFDPMRMARDHTMYSGPLVVLVDERCGSGGDVFPACVQDVERGVVIGHITAGKVLAGDIIDLPLGMQLLYPTGEAIRLNGTRLEGNGVSPDLVMRREDAANDQRIMKAALRWLEER